MQYSGKAIQLRLLEDNVANIEFDLQNSVVNVINSQVLDELTHVIDQLATSDSITSCIFTSAKDVFIAGAEIPALLQAANSGERDQVEAFIGYGHQVFNTIEALPFVTVSSINGFALGGGLEMALSTDLRVISSQAKIGLPEVNLGVFPGWGGTVRLPRLIAPEVAAQWIASGAHQSAQKALQVGAVDRLVESPDALLSAARELAAQHQDDYLSLRAQKTGAIDMSEDSRTAIDDLTQSLNKRPGPNYPAAAKAIECILSHADKTTEEASDIEIRDVSTLLLTDTAKNLLSVFLNEQAASKAAKKVAKGAPNTEQAAVIGAGIMGGGIAYQSALRNIPVVMKDIHQSALDLGMQEADSNFATLVKRGKIDEDAKQTGLARITPTLNNDDLSGVDFLVEAVVENTGVKKAVLADLEQRVPADAVIASNTSTISITRLAEDLQRPENFCGMHFFNPVPVMPLVEVIRGEKTSDDTIARAVNYALQLGKKPVVVNDCPAFLVNRVLFPYVNAAFMLIEEGADYQQLDRVMEAFGWPMGPAFLSDVVGGDTMVHCLDVLAEDIPERMAMPFKTAAHKLAEEDRLGQKNGLGFYQYVKNDKGRLEKQTDPRVTELLYSGDTREVDALEIEQRLMLAICLEMVRCIEEGIVASPAEADMAVLWGIGFPRFRGGALRYIDTIGIEPFCQMVEKYAHLGAMYQMPTLLKDMRAAGNSFYSC